MSDDRADYMGWYVVAVSVPEPPFAARASEVFAAAAGRIRRHEPLPLDSLQTPFVVDVLDQLAAQLRRLEPARDPQTDSGTRSDG